MEDYLLLQIYFDLLTATCFSSIDMVNGFLASYSTFLKLDRKSLFCQKHTLF